MATYWDIVWLILWTVLVAFHVSVVRASTKISSEIVNKGEPRPTNLLAIIVLAGITFPFNVAGLAWYAIRLLGG